MKQGTYYVSIDNSKEKSHWKDSRIEYDKKNIAIGCNLFVVKSDLAQKSDIFRLLYNPLTKELTDKYEKLTHIIKKAPSIQIKTITEGDNDNVKIYTPRLGSFWISDNPNMFIFTYHRKIAESIAQEYKQNLIELLDQTNNSFQQIKKYLEIKK